MRVKASWAWLSLELSFKAQGLRLRKSSKAQAQGSKTLMKLRDEAQERQYRAGISVIFLKFQSWLHYLEVPLRGGNADKQRQISLDILWAICLDILHEIFKIFSKMFLKSRLTWSSMKLKAQLGFLKVLKLEAQAMTMKLSSHYLLSWAYLSFSHH